MKFVDFGTCKDLIQKDLNGQEFVGTAEYMSPEVVESEESGPETDLWSLGVVFYQMLAGYTAFLAASPYLSFLRIKRALIRMPSFATESSKELLSLLIQKKKKKRMQSAASMVSSETSGGKATLSYDKLRQLAFFKEDNFKFPDPFNTSQDDIIKVPKLSEIALRAVGLACHVAAEKISLNGGSRTDLEDWVQVLISHLLPIISSTR
jgi:serine/threonine protein kinase